MTRDELEARVEECRKRVVSVSAQRNRGGRNSLPRKKRSRNAAGRNWRQQLR